MIFELAREVEGLGGLEIDRQHILGRCLYGQVTGLFALENAGDVSQPRAGIWSQTAMHAEDRPAADVPSTSVRQHDHSRAKGLSTASIADLDARRRPGATYRAVF